MKIKLRLLLSTVLTTLVTFIVIKINSSKADVLTIIFSLSTASVLSYLFADIFIPWIDKKWNKYSKNGGLGYKTDGYWWQWIDSDELLLVSFIEFRFDAERSRMFMLGTTYSTRGEAVARWRSSSGTLNEENLEIFYQWSGERIAKPEETVSGMGVYQFYSLPKGRLENGSGYFSELFLSDSNQTRRTIEIERAQDNEVAQLGSAFKKIVLDKINFRQSLLKKIANNSMHTDP